MQQSEHPIQLVSRLTGLSMHVIRIWEQRYRAVEPERTHTNRRRYSPQQIERLRMLREATEMGCPIGQVASLSDAGLRKLIMDSQKAARGKPVIAVSAAAPQFAGSAVDECLVPIRSLDADGLLRLFSRAETELGMLGVLHRLIAPLAWKIGELWRVGELTSAHEHFATAVIRDFLSSSSRRAFGVLSHAPVLLVATLTGQIHELGALLVAAAATHYGWRVTYLGASLPAAEIAGAAKLSQARVVALSLVYPDDDPALVGELQRLREFLPAEVPILAGGRAASSYRGTLDAVGALRIDNFLDLGRILDDFRKSN